MISSRSSLREFQRLHAKIYSVTNDRNYSIAEMFFAQGMAYQCKKTPDVYAPKEDAQIVYYQELRWREECAALRKCLDMFYDTWIAFSTDSAHGMGLTGMGSPYAKNFYNAQRLYENKLKIEILPCTTS